MTELTVTDEPLFPDAKISASQLGMFLPDRDILAGREDPDRGLTCKGCPRQWALHYPGEIERKGGPQLDFGIELHEALEDMTVLGDKWPEKWPMHWTGAEPTAKDRLTAKIAVMALAMYRLRPTGALVAEPTYFLNDPDEGVSYYIKPDLTAERKCFVDWKSTSASFSHSPWILHGSGEEIIVRQLGEHWRDSYNPLSRDIQGNLYALGLCTKWRERSAEGIWAYGSKKFKPGQMPKTWDVRHTFTKTSAMRYFEEVIRPTARTMLSIKQGIASGDIDSPLLIPHVSESCDHRGKFCDASAWCNLSDSPIPLSALKLPVPKPDQPKKDQDL